MIYLFNLFFEHCCTHHWESYVEGAECYDYCDCEDERSKFDL